MKKNDLLDINENIRSLEEIGGMVILPDTIEKKIENFKIAKKEKANKKAEQIKKRNAGYFKPLDVMDVIEEGYDLMDSIVPACCSQGCEVEPDGYCEHGHPSVLLYNGMI